MKKMILLLSLLVLTATALGCQPAVPAPNEGTTETKVESSSGTGTQAASNKTVERSEFIFGTLVQIKLYEGGSEEIANDMIARLHQLDGLLSTSKSDSDIFKINASAGVEPVKVSKETMDIIQRGLDYCKLSGGRFDITVEPLVVLWGIGSEGARVPENAEIEATKKLIDYTKVQVDPQQMTVYLPEKEMGVDLGAIAKGFAADEMIRLLKSKGVKRAIVNLGGNVIVLGNKSEDTPWRVGIQNPNTNRGEYLGIVGVADQTVVTSGIYERYFEQDGKRYHHILDTQTGFPVESNVASVSIVTSSSIDADALSTVAFTLGIDKGLELINSLDGIECMYVTKDHKIYASNGFKSFFELTDTGFEWGN